MKTACDHEQKRAAEWGQWSFAAIVRSCISPSARYPFVSRRLGLRICACYLGWLCNAFVNTTPAICRRKAHVNTGPIEGCQMHQLQIAGKSEVGLRFWSFGVTG